MASQVRLHFAVASSLTLEREAIARALVAEDVEVEVVDWPTPSIWPEPVIRTFDAGLLLSNFENEAETQRAVMLRTRIRTSWVVVTTCEDRALLTRVLGEDLCLVIALPAALESVARALRHCAHGSLGGRGRGSPITNLAPAPTSGSPIRR